MSKIFVITPLARPPEVSNALFPGTSVSAATRENVHLLQKAADYRALGRKLRFSGVGDIGWGAICGLMCCAGLHEDGSLCIPLFVVTLFLLGVGAWVAAAPSPTGMLCDGIMLLLLGGCGFILYARSNTWAKNGAPGFFLFVGLAEAFIGLLRLTRYPRYAALRAESSPEAVNWLADVAESTVATRPEADATLIEFSWNDFRINSQCRGRLLAEIAVLVFVDIRHNDDGESRISESYGHGVQLASKNAITIFSEKKALFRSAYVLSASVNQQRTRIVIPAASLAKLKNWLGAGPTAPGI